MKSGGSPRGLPGGVPRRGPDDRRHDDRALSLDELLDEPVVVGSGVVGEAGVEVADWAAAVDDEEEKWELVFDIEL